MHILAKYTQIIEEGKKVKDIESELRQIEQAFLGSSDIRIRRINAGHAMAAIVYIDGLIDRELLEENVIKPLTHAEKLSPTAESIQRSIYYCEELRVKDNREEIIELIAEGDIALLVEGSREYFGLSIRKYPRRAVEEPPTSTVFKGPREGFVEDIKTNLAMVRRRVRSPNLVVYMTKSGKLTGTPIAVIYIEGVASPHVVSKVKERIENINMDGIIDSSYVARYLEEKKYSLFTEVGVTEKPDIMTAKILEGRVAVIVDGSPIVLTVPMLLMEEFQDSFDYYNKSWRASLLRFLRLLGAFFTIFLPAVYLAFTAHAYSMLPLRFLMSVMNAVVGITFNAPIEMLVVLVLFEVLNQASLRMPRFLGISLSIVGAIVLGNTAVQAGLISSPAVLVTAVSAIGLFCVPDQVSTFSFLRMLVLIVSAVLGLFGVILAAIMLVAYLSNLNSYGAPYLAPYAPIVLPDMKDSFLKDGVPTMTKRPYSFPNRNRTRQRHPDQNS
jgi:spore germination protein KA